MPESSRIKTAVADYYTKRLQEFGATPRGVDWNSEDSQILRFQELCKLLPASDQPDTVLDYGCGYGKMCSYIAQEYPRLRYSGFDISSNMLSKAKSLFADADAIWYERLPESVDFDYVIASGIFNVKMGHSIEEWEDYIEETLQEFNRTAKKGFSFNILTSYSDAEYKRDDLYYAEPERLFSYCKKHFSRRVALLHDSPLYEFTIIVRKE